MLFSTGPGSTCTVYVYKGLNCVTIALKTSTTDLLKSTLMIYFVDFSFSLIYLELKRQIRLYAIVVPLKTIPDFRP